MIKKIALFFWLLMNANSWGCETLSTDASGTAYLRTNVANETIEIKYIYHVRKTGKNK